MLGPDDKVYYTRDGSFKLSADGNTLMLVTADGYPVLDDSGNPIVLTALKKIYQYRQWV